MYSFYFFKDTATTEIFTLSLHDALPIWGSTSEDLRRLVNFLAVNLVDDHEGVVVEAEQRGQTVSLTLRVPEGDRKSTRLSSSHAHLPYAGFCFKRKKES